MAKLLQKVLFLSFLSCSLILIHGPWALAQEPATPSPPAEATPSTPLPQDPLQRGQELLRRGDLPGAESAFLEAIQKAPKQPEPLFFLGAVYLEKNEPEKAIEQFEKVLKILPNHLPSYLNLGRAYERLQRREEAIAVLKKAIEIQPAFYPAYLVLGQIFEAEGKGTEAVEAYQAVVRTGDDLPEAQEAVKRAKERLAQTGETPEVASRAQELFEKGQEFFKNNQIKEAREAFEEILKLIPENVTAQYLLAQVFLEMGNIFGAARLLEQTIKIDPNAWQAFHLLGQLYESQGRLDEAILAYLVVARLVTEGPVNQDVRRRLASLKDLVEERRLREILRKDVPLAEARKAFEEGIAALQQGNSQGAIKRLTDAARLDPTNPYYLYNLGIAYFSETKLIEATQALQKSIEMRKEYGPAHFFLAQIYVASGGAARDAGDLVGATQEYRKALAEFDQALSLGAEKWQNKEASQKKAQLYESIGKIQEANGHTILGTSRADRKEWEGALREYRLASELVPEDPFSRISIGVVYEELKEVEKAIQAYEGAAKASPKNPAPYIHLGQLYENVKRMKEAEQAYQSAIERSPKLPDPVIRLGSLYFGQERLEEAKAQYLKAIELDPKQAEPFFYLGQIYEREGKEKEAVGAYEKAKDLLPPQMNVAKFIRDRLAALERFSGRWTHTFLSYDTNTTAVHTNPIGEFSSRFTLGLSYVALRINKIHPVLPVPLSVPVEFSTGTSTFLRSSRLSNSESVSLSLQTALGTAYDLGGSYTFSFSQTDERPVALNHSWNASVGRSGSIPSRAGIALSSSSLTSLINARDNRVTQGIGTQITQSLSGYGSLSFDYTFSLDSTARLDQSGKNHDFSFGYNSPLFGKLAVNGGISFSLTDFDVPRIIPVAGQRAIVQTIEKNRTYNFRVGGAYPLGSGLTLSTSYRYQVNQSNLDIPRPPVDATQQELERIRPTDNYQKHLFTFSIAKSF